MYHVVICDDEETILKDIGERVETEFSKMNIDIRKTLVSNAHKLQRQLKEETVDVLFLDIDMPHMNGMEIAGWIQERNLPLLLVFVTSQDTLVYQTFRYQPFGFIRKSVFLDEIEEVVQRLSEKLQSGQDFMVWQQNGENVRVKLQDISYIEADSNYVNVITTEKIYRFRDTLSALEKRLEGKWFIRIHKGFLINGEKMHIMKSDSIEMEDGTQLPIGRSYSEEVKKKITILLRNCR